MSIWKPAKATLLSNLMKPSSQATINTATIIKRDFLFIGS